MLSTNPPQRLFSPRLFVGRNVEGASLSSLCDSAGLSRLNLEVDEKGVADITFLHAAGKLLRTIPP